MNQGIKIIIDIPPGYLNEDGFSLLVRHVRKTIKDTTGLSNVMSAEYVEPVY